MVIFAVHNLIKDPPFSKLDLVSCRNVLIYLKTELQRKICPVSLYPESAMDFSFSGLPRASGMY